MKIVGAYPKKANPQGADPVGIGAVFQKWLRIAVERS
jgi:hypothetical protein